ncbi:Bug family tripartite tricarboxylate transporter substrate binding protein [Mycolicibacterium celeriflavum]|uniref:C4-dicarboxylate ABC transporter substrate-binding protein n=1 Tax=Mycolicibacterium celeriflavum TaxID=1249101 RepID=A0A1X0C145_MYCCF|nr:tripartite tricarboxylate transporter substrate-binding protein [Mycolicibacterium celeriflavum]MCV7238341.1 tripartite tricarboxylate transporter substrate binding protein [Mycolicibacterium celeriflavum]ORA50982.1 tricarboxylic transporter [Mycolicibacterium celeriflavum]BBY44852.1 C4-dicarboxylate ABC transporter substrate-binding protein [Mycolicibacterium celeriflavum]
MRIPTAVRWVLGLVCVGALVVAAGVNANRTGSGAEARAKLTLVAPAAAGGGWDLVARESQQALRSNRIANNVQVVNVPGAAGAIGLSQLSRLGGDPTTMMVTGTVMLGGVERNDSPVALSDMTPIARLAEDFEVIVVPADSPYQTLGELIEAWRADPAAMPIGGGSAGGIDHMVAAQLAREAGIDPEQIRYAAYAGGGELTINLLSTAPGTPDVGISGYNDFRDMLVEGRLRTLMVVAPERLEGLDAPTAAEAGYPAVDLVNWRGYVAPEGLTDAEQQELIEIVGEMVKTEHWQSVVARNRWKETFLTGDDFGRFIRSEEKRVKTILDDLGLA